MTGAILKKQTESIPEGKIEINETIGLATVKFLEIKKTRKKHKEKSPVYNVAANVLHPRYGNMSFSFDYVPAINKTTQFMNVKGENICMGTPPHGDIKDIVIAAISDESYAYQLSNKRTTWCHAERDPEQGEYLLWHWLYYGKYSPRSKWKLPAKCEKEKVYEQHKCNLCNGQKCPHLMKTCTLCGNHTARQCPLCMEPVCAKHSACKNKHPNLTPDGMFRGSCGNCGRKVPIEEKACSSCGSTNFRVF